MKPSLNLSLLHHKRILVLQLFLAIQQKLGVWLIYKKRQCGCAFLLLCTGALSLSAHAQNIPPAMTWQQAQALTLDIYPQVVVNGYHHPKSVRFIQKAGGLYITPAALQQLDIHIPPSVFAQAQWLDAQTAKPDLQPIQSDTHTTITDTTNHVMQAKLQQRWFALASLPKLQVRFDANNSNTQFNSPISMVAFAQKYTGAKKRTGMESGTIRLCFGIRL